MDVISQISQHAARYSVRVKKWDNTFDRHGYLFGSNDTEPHSSEFFLFIRIPDDGEETKIWKSDSGATNETLHCILQPGQVYIVNLNGVGHVRAAAEHDCDVSCAIIR